MTRDVVEDLETATTTSSDEESGGRTTTTQGGGSDDGFLRSNTTATTLAAPEHRKRTSKILTVAVVLLILLLLGCSAAILVGGGEGATMIFALLTTCFIFFSLHLAFALLSFVKDLFVWFYGHSTVGKVGKTSTDRKFCVAQHWANVTYRLPGARKAGTMPQDPQSDHNTDAPPFRPTATGKNRRAAQTYDGCQTSAFSSSKVQVPRRIFRECQQANTRDPVLLPIKLLLWPEKWPFGEAAVVLDEPPMQFLIPCGCAKLSYFAVFAGLSSTLGVCLALYVFCVIDMDDSGFSTCTPSPWYVIAAYFAFAFGLYLGLELCSVATTNATKRRKLNNEEAITVEEDDQVGDENVEESHDGSIQIQRHPPVVVGMPKNGIV